MPVPRVNKTTGPFPWRRVRVILPFVTIVALMLFLGSASLGVMLGVRAFANAESSRSKALSSAVSSLEQYAQTRNEDSYARYLAELAAIVALRDARIELEKLGADMSLVRQGLRNARIHPDDIDSMIDLYRRFRGVGFMATTLALWDQADAQIVDFAATGQALQATISGGKVDADDLQPLLARVRTLDRHLGTLDEAVAATLGEASRQTGALLTLINFAVGIALVLIAVVATHRLIREGEDLQSELRTTEERFEYAVLASNDGIWDWSLWSEQIQFSARFESLLGHEPGAMRESAASFLRRIHPRDRNAAASGLRAHLRAGDAFDLEFRIRVQDGTYRWFRTRGRSLLGPEGKPQRMVGSLTDITERKQSEAQIFEEKERAQVTLASIADAVITVDTSGRIEFLNPVAERLTGWRNEDARRGPGIVSVFRYG